MEQNLDKQIKEVKTAVNHFYTKIENMNIKIRDVKLTPSRGDKVEINFVTRKKDEDGIREIMEHRIVFTPKELES